MWKVILFLGISNNFCDCFVFFWVISSENPLNNQVVAVMVQEFANYYAKIHKTVSVILFCATSCFEYWEGDHSFSENPKNKTKNIFWM